MRTVITMRITPQMNTIIMKEAKRIGKTPQEFARINMENGIDRYRMGDTALGSYRDSEENLSILFNFSMTPRDFKWLKERAHKYEEKFSHVVRTIFKKDFYRFAGRYDMSE